jgi:Ca2+-binding EF-hand superfamily protein
MRLFGKINGKEDGDVTRSEFNNALDNNVLPIRYSQAIIDQMFALVNEKNIQNQGIDKLTFVFLDFSLRLFSVPNATRPYYISSSDFSNILNNTLFPNKTLGQIYAIPSYGMTNLSFQMFSSMNISQFYTEDDYLLKFLQVKNSKSFKKSLLLEKLEKVFGSPAAAPAAGAAAANSSLPVFNISIVSSNIFSLLDIDNDGWVKFQDFAHFMQLLYIFNKNDNYGKGKLTIGKVINIFKSYSEYPRISHINRERVRRLDMVYQDLLINAFELIAIFKIDDIVEYYVRETDKTTLYEVDLKNILAKCGLRYMPDSYLNKCLRGNDANNIPRYDWECSITTGITLMSQYYEAAYSYTTAKLNGLNLTNTVFNNVDPQIK